MSDSGRYEVRIETEARKYLSALDQSNLDRISKKIYELANNPRPVGYKSKKGSPMTIIAFVVAITE